ncbi:MAG: bifunctional DNA primase/polymerase [Chloroflexota bacterium]|nr:bifunctional DNA primase/polymerase [Chloroflexota bacterium]
MTAQRQPADESPALAAALDYTAIGWSIFPCHTGDPTTPTGCDCRKATCGDPGKHPRTQNGLTSATTDEAQIRRWWGMWPTANVAVRTGAVSGIAVIDVDGPAGWQAIHEEERRRGPLPPTVVAQTGGGGSHLVYAHPGRHVRTRQKVLTGVDVRGDGGYILADPSRHASGRTYRWEAGHSPHDHPPAALPPAWVDLLCPPQQERPQEGPRPSGSRRLTDADISAAVDLLRPHYEEGARHDLTLHLAGWLARQEYAEMDAARLIDRLAVDDPERSGRLRNVRTSYDHAAAGDPVAGWSRLREILTPGDLLELQHLLGRPAPRLHVGRNGRHAEANDVTDEEAQEAPNPNADDTGGPPPPRRPEIDAGDQDLDRVTDAAWKALVVGNNPPYMFRFGGASVRLDRDDLGARVPRPLTEDRVRHELANKSTWFKVGAKGQVSPAYPPTAVVRNVLARAEHPLPTLLRVVEVPILAPDGTLQTTPGYHPESRTYYEPAAGFTLPPVPTHPTEEEITKARDLILDDLIGEFPFTSEAERANAVALFLDPYVRDLIDGPTPLRLIEAPTPGSGKSLLADVLTRPAIGRQVGMMPGANDDDEWRKKITSQLRESPAAILIDNVSGNLDSASLSIALTATFWKDRLLGGNETTQLPVRCVWLATANNPTMSTEIARRTVRIRLDPRVDRPWQRTEFRHRDLRGWADEHRAELVRAALVLCRAWIAAGQPLGATVLGSYERWSAVLGGILGTTGIRGFLENLETFYEEADIEGAIWRQFINLWAAEFGEQEVETSQLFELANSVEGFDFGFGNERSQRTSFGKQLARQHDRVIGEYRIARTGGSGKTKSHKSKKWRLLGGSSHDGPPSGEETGGHRGHWGTSGNHAYAQESTNGSHVGDRGVETSPNVPYVPHIPGDREEVVI